MITKHLFPLKCIVVLASLMLTCNDDPSLIEQVENNETLFINEFMASNDTCYTDENGDYDDWVEIYNGGLIAVDLGGYYLSDDHEIPLQIPGGLPSLTTVDAGEFIVFWFDDTPDQGPLHIEYKLGADGDAIYLYDTDGTTELDSYIFSSQTTDVSEGRTPDGNETWMFFDSPTPGHSNI